MVAIMLHITVRTYIMDHNGVVPLARKGDNKGVFNSKEILNVIQYSHRSTLNLYIAPHVLKSLKLGPSSLLYNSYSLKNNHNSTQPSIITENFLNQGVYSYYPFLNTIDAP